jgi:hypothetical protein
LLPGKYCGIEPERWLVAAGLKHELGGCGIVDVKRPRFSNEQCFDLTVFNQSFDYIVAQSIFSHTTMAQMGQCIDSASEIMHGNSMFLFNFKHGDNYAGDKWVYPGVVTFSKTLVRRLLGHAGLTWTEIPTWERANGAVWVKAELA